MLSKEKIFNPNTVSQGIGLICIFKRTRLQLNMGALTGINYETQREEILKKKLGCVH